MRTLVVVAFCVGLPCFAHADELEPFTTDGCSLWLDGTPERPNLWRHCCVAHDLAYWTGGSEAARQKADDELRICVQAAQGSGMADYMYENVRWGGSPYWVNYYRWGYGWDYFDGLWPRGYKEATPEEQQQIARLLPAAKQLLEDDALTYPARAASSSTSHSSSGGAQEASAAR